MGWPVIAFTLAAALAGRRAHGLGSAAGVRTLNLNRVLAAEGKGGTSGSARAGAAAQSRGRADRDFGRLARWRGPVARELPQPVAYESRVRRQQRDHRVVERAGAAVRRRRRGARFHGATPRTRFVRFRASTAPASRATCRWARAAAGGRSSRRPRAAPATVVSPWRIVITPGYSRDDVYTARPRPRFRRARSGRRASA